MWQGGDILDAESLQPRRGVGIRWYKQRHVKIHRMHSRQAIQDPGQWHSQDETHQMQP
jgi:hypothetical protein